MSDWPPLLFHVAEFSFTTLAPKGTTLFFALRWRHMGSAFFVQSGAKA
jgi:hypothetical protein